MSKTHFMLDLETLGTEPGCIILSIGCAQFDPLTGDIGKTFYTEINQRESEEIGLTSDPKTLAFWEMQDDAAKDLLNRTKADKTHPVQACIQLADFIYEVRPLLRERIIWANSPSFDCDILAHLFKTVELEIPWEFYNEQDCRTLVELGRSLDIDPKRDMPFTGTPHHALDDAIHQAKYISAISQHIHGLKGH